jgi:uncharacterized damage-inducible protein DinB
MGGNAFGTAEPGKAKMDIADGAEGAIMQTSGLLVDAFDRVRESVHQAADGLTAEELAARLDADANSIAWLLWHLTRVQDDHIADVAGGDQAWTSQGWADRFGLPFSARATGYGHSSRQVGQVVVASPALLTGYHDAVHEQTTSFVRGLKPADLDRIVDTAWDPPVTLGVRLVSVIADTLEHAGQAAFVRGVVLRGRG